MENEKQERDYAAEFGISVSLDELVTIFGEERAVQVFRVIAELSGLDVDNLNVQTTTLGIGKWNEQLNAKINTALNEL